MKAFLARNWFVASLPLVIALAWAFPSAASKGGWLRPEVTTDVGVALIFLLQGMALPTAALATGASRWRLHALVQSFTFVVFPIMGIALDAVAGRALPPDLRLGFLFLCVLPSTVSSSVVLTQLAGGNTVGAIFNAAMSNVIGVLVTPLWVAWLARAGGGHAEMGGVLQKVFLLLLAPLAAGQALRWRLKDWVEPRKKALGNLSGALILYLVFAAFCESVTQRVWSGMGPGVTAGAALGVLLVFVLAMLGTHAIARLLRLDRPDWTAAMFCAPQKTIASGIPLAKAIFGAHPGLGLILLPVLLYHPLQLVVCGALAARWSRTPDGKRQATSIR